MESIIKSEILNRHKEIIHGISTKQGGTAPYYNNLSRHVGDDIKNVISNRSRFFGLLGADEKNLVHANQIHSGNVTIAEKPGLYPETDALITSEKNLFLIISIADCIPVMVYDSVKQVIANIHSGWRGTQKLIAVNTINKMITGFGCKTENMAAFIGPGIGKEKFEVGREVAELFDKKYVLNHKTESMGANPCIDLKRVVKDQLLSCGLKEENIESSGYCTYTQKDMFHSYRRDGDKSGRMFAVIGIKNSD